MKEQQMLESLQKAIVKLQTTQMEFDAYKRQINEPIAIIGIGCRFPIANHVKNFWNLLAQGQDCITEIPKDRWDVDLFYNPNPNIPNKMDVRNGGFLNSPIDQFDANFFNISHREAEWMDPQQRLLLEVTWEALENAAINPLSLKGSKVGVFIGQCAQDYFDLIKKTSEDINIYQTTGNAFSITSGRLSYFLGLQGPSTTVDSACSSLNSIHLACKSLQRGESQLAIAGGVNIILNPTLTISFARVTY